MKAKRVFKYMCIVLVSLLTLNIGAQTLEDYLVQAAENNPQLKASYNEYLASLQKIPQVGALPDPQLSFGFFIMPMERYAGNQIMDISIMQMFPWFGTLGAAKDEATLMSKARFEQFKEVKSELFFEVRTNYYALYLLDKEISITEENIEILQTLERIVLNRFAAGGSESMTPSGNEDMRSGSSGSNTGVSGSMSGMNMGMQATPAAEPVSRDRGTMGAMGSMAAGGGMVDVLRVQMEINELQNKLELLTTSRKPLLAKFNQLLNRQPGNSVVVPDSLVIPQLPVPLAELTDSIIQNNPMLKMLQQEEKAFVAQQEMNRRMGFPMIGAGLQYGIFSTRPGSESSMNGKNMIMPMASVSIPIWRRKYDASVREAELMQEAVRHRKENTRNLLLVEYEDVMNDYQDAVRRAALFRNQTELADQILNLLTVQYKTGISTFDEVLRIQQQLLDYRLKKLDASVDANIALAMLERLMGR